MQVWCNIQKSIHGSSHCGTGQWVSDPLVFVEAPVRSPAQHRGLRIQYCCSYSIGCSFSLDLILGLGTSIWCRGVGRSKKGKKPMPGFIKMKLQGSKDRETIFKATRQQSSHCGTGISGSGIQRCHELWCRSQMQLGSSLLWPWCRLGAVASIQPQSRNFHMPREWP